jgi:hypothetical protein
VDIDPQRVVISFAGMIADVRSGELGPISWLRETRQTVDFDYRLLKVT